MYINPIALVSTEQESQATYERGVHEEKYRRARIFPAIWGEEKSWINAQAAFAERQRPGNLCC